jgi:hypothetical protein
MEALVIGTLSLLILAATAGIVVMTLDLYEEYKHTKRKNRR